MPKAWRGDVTGQNQDSREKLAKADNDCMAAKRDLYCWLGGLLHRNDSVTALTKCTELMKAANDDMGWECYKINSNDFLTGALRFCRQYMAQAVSGGRPPKVTQEYPGFVPQQLWTNPNDNKKDSRTLLAENLARVARKNQDQVKQRNAWIDNEARILRWHEIAKKSSEGHEGPFGLRP